MMAAMATPDHSGCPTVDQAMKMARSMKTLTPTTALALFSLGTSSPAITTKADTRPAGTTWPMTATV